MFAGDTGPVVAGTIVSKTPHLLAQAGDWLDRLGVQHG